MEDFKVKGYTVAQFPNAPLIFALVSVVLSRLFDEGTTANGICRAVFYVGLAIWAYLELIEGVNGFRRVLGALGLAFVLFSIARD